MNLTYRDELGGVLMTNVWQIYQEDGKLIIWQKDDKKTIIDIDQLYCVADEEE